MLDALFPTIWRNCPFWKEINDSLIIQWLEYILIKFTITLKATWSPYRTYSLNISIWAASCQNQQNGMCAQRRLRSAWASAQSDQSLRCPPEETLCPTLPTERTTKTLIRLGGCPGWSESSLGEHVILLVLSCGGSYMIPLCKLLWLI